MDEKYKRHPMPVLTRPSISSGAMSAGVAGMSSAPAPCVSALYAAATAKPASSWMNELRRPRSAAAGHTAVAFLLQTIMTA